MQEYKGHEIRCCKMKFRHAQAVEAAVNTHFLSSPEASSFIKGEAIRHTQTPLVPTALTEATALLPHGAHCPIWQQR